MTLSLSRRNLQSCIDRLGYLSAKFARSTPLHEKACEELAEIEQYVANREWLAAQTGLINFKVRMQCLRADVAIREALGLLFAATGYLDECEGIDTGPRVAGMALAASRAQRFGRVGAAR